MATQQGFIGVTPPISTSESNDREKEVTVSLMEELRRQNAFENEEEARTREIVMGRVAALVKKFVRTVSLSRGLSEAAANAAGGKIFTFGSYRLGVHGPGSDIDTLCVVPKHVSREDFFEVFEPMLREAEGAMEVSGVPEAYVPIIKTKISGIPIDFLMARLALSSIPDDLSLQDNNLLRNLDERCVRSLNGKPAVFLSRIPFIGTSTGSRVNDEIMRLVPNVEVFRDSLRSWPQPVLLKQIEEGPLQVRVWNPKLYPGDRSHRMPIITPAYPAMCATHNVTASTQMIMTEEFKKGADIVDKVIIGKASWSELFERHDFFLKYRYYLQVIASTGDPELQMKWSGTVESRIRQLVMKLEYVDSLTLAHPFIKGFNRICYCLSEEEVQAVAQGEISDAIANRKKEDIEGKEGASLVYSTTFYIGLAIEPKQPGAVGPRRLDISYPTTEFTKMVKLWEHFDEAKMGIIVRHIKSSGLPDNVFDVGERPAKLVQKRVKVCYNARSVRNALIADRSFAHKGPGKSGDTSPHKPSKKPRTSRSSNTTPEVPLRSTTTGNSSASTPVSFPPVAESPGMFASKDHLNVKSPQLPFGENVAVATGPVGAS
ncbi:hypothetical protein DXG03_000087 [Asterophora parasitica]|uniref:Poly(A) polymerase n=1 Tax=Asterophora parasitica TaxID=117018 RepID=A0A9P7GG77_9AGAR|nr:hypothetical protein DXG03_000087 [Asterophora parasitica]